MQMAGELVSFDIFDTLILRLVRRPWDVFGVMYGHNSELLVNSFTRDEWIGYRRELEKSAWEKKRDYNIFDIYKEGQFSSFNYLTFVDAEFQSECEVCFLNPFIVKRIQDEKNRGNKVALVSDMYWPREYIERLLKNCGFSEEVDAIFISNEHGCTKEDGGLFDVVSDYFNIPAEGITHIGDNIRSDYVSARRNSLKMELYPAISFKDMRFPFLYMESDKAGICSLPIRLLAEYYNNNDADVWHTIGAMIYGPFVVGAMEWLVDLARKEKINRIFTFMREGELFANVLRKMLKNSESGLNVEALYVSRSSLKRSLSEEEQAKNALDYFKQMGLDAPFISFDIGYGGTIASFLDEFLDANGIREKRIHCLGVQWSKSYRNIIDGHDIRGFIHAENENERNDIIAWIFEMCFMCDKGSTCGYDSAGSPMTQEIVYGKEQVDGMIKCQKGIMDYVDAYCEVKKSKKDFKIESEECYEILSRFFHYPLVNEANTVRNMEYDESFFDNFMWKAIEDREIDCFKRKGFSSFEGIDNGRQLEWVAGINTICNPHSPLIMSAYNKQDYSKAECINDLMRIIETIPEKEKVYLVGFGKWGKESIAILNALDLLERVEAIIDNEKLMHGLEIIGKKIIGITDSDSGGCRNYILTVQNKKVRDELEAEIKTINPNAKISSLW